MEKTALKILKLLDGLGWSDHDIDMLGWHLVNLSHKPMLRRLEILSDSIMHYAHDMKERNHDGL